MDVHQKRAAVISGGATIVAYSLVVFILRLTFFDCAIIAVCCILVALLFLWINHWMRPYLNGKEYPNNVWYRKHSERNYDVLILGDDISRSRIPDELLRDKKVFDCSLSDQSLYADFLVLKNAFSILKPQGAVYLPLREASIKYIDDRFSDERRYYWALSPYVFNPSPISCAMKKIYTRIPGLLFRFKDLLFLLRWGGQKSEAVRTTSKIKKENSWLENTPEKIKNDFLIKQKCLLERMQQFCNERDIQLIIIDV